MVWGEFIHGPYGSPGEVQPALSRGQGRPSLEERVFEQA